MLLRSDAGKGLEPVGVVGGTLSPAAQSFMALATTSAVLMLMLSAVAPSRPSPRRNTFLGRRSRITETLNTFVPNSSVIAVLISSQPFPFP